MEAGAGPSVDTLRELLDAFNRYDPDAVMSFFADDCTMDLPRGPDPWGRRLEGKDAVRAGIAGRFAGIPDVHYGHDRHFVCGSFAVSEWTLTGTTTSGERVEVRGCDHFEFRGELIVRKDSYWKIVEPEGGH